MRLIAVLMCGFGALPTAASEGPHWLKVKSPNFELFTTAGERNGREVARHFEQVRAFFLEAQRLGVKSGPAVRIVLFRSDKEFAPYAPNDFASAYYLGAEDRDYIVMKSASSDQFHVAVHEYTHLLVKHTGIKPPIWFNEGLAELFSNLKPLGGKIEVGDMILPHVALLRQSRWIDLETLLAVGQDSPLYNEKAQAGLFYAESWALVHMLYLGADYRPKLAALLEGIGKGARMPETFEKAYGKPLDAVQKDLEAYLHGTTFNASVFNLKLAKDVDTPETSASSELEAGLVLAEILANMRSKAGDAREMYGRLARGNPKDWQVEQGLARLSFREGKRAEALMHYARAVELGGTNPRMYLDYGRLLRASDKREEAVAVLQRATEMDPDDGDARLELGYAYVVADQHAEALAQLKLVKRVTPEQAFGYFHAMAYSYYRLDRKEEAKGAAAKCRQYARTAEEMARIDQLAAALDDAPHEAAPPRTLRRRAALEVAEGTLKQIDCLDGRLRLRIGVGGETLSFAVLDPAGVTMRDHSAMDFTCGAQSPRRIRIEYEAREGAMPETLGVVRTIAFPE